MKTKKFRFIILLFTLIMALTPLTMTACSFFGPSESDIQILDSRLTYVNGGSGLSLVVKIKNNSSSTIKTSFNVNIYKDGAVFDSTISGVITLGVGEVGQLDSITLISRQYGNYTYKITKWNFYNV